MQIRPAIEVGDDNLDIYEGEPISMHDDSDYSESKLRMPHYKPIN